MTEKWHRNPKLPWNTWNTERCLPKTKQNIKKEEHSIRYKEKCSELLCNIGVLIWVRMLDNFLTNEAPGTVLKEGENIMNLRWSIKENRNKKVNKT